MKLKTVQIKRFRNIIDSNVVRITDDITCFVGKNESGKTSFLHALYRLNPARENAKFMVEDNYPAWLEKKDKLKGENLKEFIPVSVVFELSDKELKILNDTLGEGVILNNQFRLERNYSNKLISRIEADEKCFIKNIFSGLSFSQETRNVVSKLDTLARLKEFIADQSIKPDVIEKDKVSIEEIKLRLHSKIQNGDSIQDVILKLLESLVPKFLYFDKYSSLPYSVKIKEVLTSKEDQLSDGMLTARSLLRMAAADDDYLLNRDYERRKRELENVANALTQDVLKYWSQNRDLRVNPDITLTEESNYNGRTTVIEELKIRIWDNKHFLSLPFNEHSTGFQWFFSFLAAFSEYEYSNREYIILLDEPGLGLHGKAQGDFLRFIEERLGAQRQVLYSTHSPFMIQPDKLERVRIVEEKEVEKGSTVTEDVLTTDSDTLFPLQGALGYDLAQHLFISKNNLVLEGTSDYTYIKIISDYLKSQNRTHLHEEWTLVPVGGADLIPTFAALLGAHLDITVVVDSRKEGNQKLSNLSSKGLLKSRRIITLNEFVNGALADIEDLFEPTDYLRLFNDAFSKNYKIADLSGTDPIVSKLARKEGVKRFDHGKPADLFLRNRDIYLDKLSDDTLMNFESLFERINETRNI